MASGAMNVVKYLLFFFNFVFWLSGLALIIVGALIKKEYGDFLQVSSSNLASAPVFLIVIGVIVAVVGFLGCCGAIKENYCMVTTFAVLLGLIFVLEIAAGALAYAYKSKLETYATEALKKSVDNYYNGTNSKAYRDFMNELQKEFNCCGYEDGHDGGYKGKIPKTCYNGTTGTNGTGKIYTTGCVKGLENKLRKHLIIVGAVGIGIAFIQLFGILFACCLMRSIKKEYEVM